MRLIVRDGVVGLHSAGEV